jgi:hypothetical protein
VVVVGGKERVEVKKGHVSIPRGQNSRCQARHIPEMECAAFACTRGTFIQCAACELNVPGIRMYVGAALGIYPAGGEDNCAGLEGSENVRDDSGLGECGGDTGEGIDERHGGSD